LAEAIFVASATAANERKITDAFPIRREILGRQLPEDRSFLSQVQSHGTEVPVLNGPRPTVCCCERGDRIHSLEADRYGPPLRILKLLDLQTVPSQKSRFSTALLPSDCTASSFLSDGMP